MNTRIAIGIPARHASTRFPGKPLAMLHGRPMIAHVIQRALLANIGPVTVATDDERIANVAMDAGARVFLSQCEHASGTERLAEAFADSHVDIVINVQGDEPLIDPLAIRSVARPFLHDSTLPMATLAHPLRNTQDLHDPNVVKVVCNAKGHAMYFSRAPIPFSLDGDASGALQHVGLYAYRRDFLLRYPDIPECPQGRRERLEQLKVLYHGHSIAVTQGDFHTIGVDTPEDLRKVERHLMGRREE